MLQLNDFHPKKEEGSRSLCYPEMKVRGKMNLVIERIKNINTLENYPNVGTVVPMSLGMKAEPTLWV